MYYMFFGCTAFNQNIGSWNTSNVTNMSRVFYGCTAFNQNIGSWNTSNVTTMESMFIGCTAFNQDIGNWNTSKVTNMGWMFIDCASFNQNINNWDTSNVTTMENMFFRCTSFNQSLNSWNVRKAIDKSNMFQMCTNFNGDISAWDTEKTIDFSYFLNYSSSFNKNLTQWCVGWHQDGTIFSDQSGLTVTNKPVWGTCPNKIVSSDITYIGSATTPSNATSVALPAHQSGDLIIAFGYLNFSNWPPSLPTGWNHLDYDFGNRIAYKIATSSSETSGSWTGYSGVSFVVYRNVEVDQFEYTRVPDGRNPSNGSTTLNYPNSNYWKNLAWSLILLVDNTSDLLNATGNTSALPSGFTTRLDTCTQGYKVLIADTNGTTSGFSSQSKIISGYTPGNCLVYVIRLRNKITSATP